MARLIYSAIASLDGYVEDQDGEFGWAAPDAEVHAFVNDLERPVGTYLYGRGMYDTMASGVPPVRGALDGPARPRRRAWGSVTCAAARAVRILSECTDRSDRVTSCHPVPASC